MCLLIGHIVSRLPSERQGGGLESDARDRVARSSSAAPMQKEPLATARGSFSREGQPSLPPDQLDSLDEGFWGALFGDLQNGWHQVSSAEEADQLVSVKDGNVAKVIGHQGVAQILEGIVLLKGADIAGHQIAHDTEGTPLFTAHAQQILFSDDSNQAELIIHDRETADPVLFQ